MLNKNSFERTEFFGLQLARTRTAQTPEQVAAKAQAVTLDDVLIVRPCFDIFDRITNLTWLRCTAGRQVCWVEAYAGVCWRCGVRALPGRAWLLSHSIHLFSSHSLLCATICFDNNTSKHIATQRTGRLVAAVEPLVQTRGVEPVLARAAELWKSMSDVTLVDPIEHCTPSEPVLAVRSLIHGRSNSRWRTPPSLIISTNTSMS